MKQILPTLFLVFCVAACFGGNPDRQGEAGANELLLNPWARSAGWHTMNTSIISGVESMRLNAAGMVRIKKTQVLIGHTRYLDGIGVNMNAVGITQRVGSRGAFGLSIMAMDFGDIAVTTTDQPEGTGATFSPNFFHIGLGYAHMFENKISVGIILRAISETTADLGAQGVALDAGVQYVTGEQDNFKFGISLRNIGTPMRFGGEGLSFRQTNPDGNINYNLTYDERSATFELPSVLNIGISYDFIFSPRNRITVLGNFTANSFSRDDIGGGVEYAFNELFMVRGAYKIAIGEENGFSDNVYTGLSAGVTFDVPLDSDKETKLGVDYAYRATNPWNGSHNLSLRISL